MSKFEFNAPQFANLTNGEDSDDADTFFDVEYEESPKPADNKENEPQVTTVKNEALSPSTDEIKPILHEIKEEVLSPKEDKSIREIKKGIRRLTADRQLIAASGLPFSKKDITENACQKLDKLSIKQEKKADVTMGEKLHNMTTRNDMLTKTLQLNLGAPNVKKEGETRKRKATPSDMPGTGKFIAMAEHNLHFQKDTPPRFHSSRRRSSGNRKDLFKARMSYKPQRTVPVTPKLLTACRSRPSVVPSKIEREILELEEMKKCQIKAMPLNEKILQPPKPLQKSEKPPTVQEPFKLTEVFKKPAPKEETYVFTANPVPKGLLQKKLAFSSTESLTRRSVNITGSMPNLKAPLRVPSISNDNHMVLEDVHGFGVPLRKVTRPRKTEVKPFSFEERELEKKERKKQEQSEETKQTFRARSPRVLRKSPFKPVLNHSHSQPHELVLNTERRLRERRQFEHQQQLKEEMIAYEKEKMALEKARKEEEEIARLREATIHKPLPMPSFKPPVKINNSLPLTEPKSPRFSKRTRNIKVSD